MYYLPTLELTSLHRCPKCGNTNSNVERADALTLVNGKLTTVKKGLVLHCRSCGCNTPLEAQQ